MMDNILAGISPTFLIIGYGNNLRSDDAVGQRVSDAIATWKLPDVRSLSVCQLTPELTNILATVDVAVFVDTYPICKEREWVGKIVELEKEAVKHRV
ncbi:hypothetical protein [Scytonema sp. UIC 10036]|uniref:hypothetical protein n=1 Tax=Scytonema sp. UIC 10036 TaxID=2304196 RepID=UPI001FA99CC8|nr:hypothetical protein [Scytonema sp. UIC 10036]